MSRTVFGLELPDEIAEGWEEVAHVVIGEVREGGAVDYRLLNETGSLRYLATGGAEVEPGGVQAPTGFDRLMRLTRQVIDSNEPVVRDPTELHAGFLLSVLPAVGRTQRVVVILEPQRRQD